MGFKLKILLLSRYFPPEIGTAANLFFELARGLARSGHDVIVATGFPWYNLDTIPERYMGKFHMYEKMDGVEVIRIRLPVFGPRKFRLAVGHLTAPLTSIVAGLHVEKPDVMLIYSPPLFLGISAWILKKFRKTPFVFGVQDLHPQCYIDQGVLKNRMAIGVLQAVEKFCYRKADLVTVHSEGNRRHIVEQKGTDPSKVKVLANWIDTDEIIPLSRDNKFSRQHGLNGKFVVGFAGTIGMSQGMLGVVDAARLLKDRKDIEFFIVGDGIEKETMISKAKEHGLDNIRFLGMQPKSVYPYVVAASDVGLVTLNSKVKTPVVPSKILSMMAAARPVLASLPLDGDAPKLIAESGCGICIGPENPEELAGKIAFLADNREICLQYGRQGREYVERHLSLKRVTNDIEQLFSAVTTEKVRKVPAS